MNNALFQAIRKRVNHDSVALVNRGNAAIFLAFQKFGTKIFAPAEGGWLTYKKYAKDLGLEYEEIACNSAVIDLVDLEKKLTPGGVFIYHSLGAYCAEQDIAEIYAICQRKGCLVIQDVSGSFGIKFCDGKYADICLGSFGKWKLADLGQGGFISFRDPGMYEQVKPLLSAFTFFGDEQKLLEKVENVEKRIAFLLEKRSQVLEDLKSQDILHNDIDGVAFVVIVRFASEMDRLRIISYCTEKGHEYVMCPREIRVNEQAVSIELKRLESN